MPSNQKKNTHVIDNLAEIILNSLPSGIIFCDSDCKIQFINKTYADYLGVDQKEVIGKPITDYIPGSRISEVLKTGEAELGFKCTVSDGKQKKILIVNRIPVFDKDRMLGVISQSLFGDIGELKDLSERLSYLEKKVHTYREKVNSILSSRYSIDDIKGQSTAILQAKEMIKQYANTDFPVLLTGETGTGKELFAHALHQESTRSRGPFVSINCAAIPKDLFESEVFGYEPGAFTGAQRGGKVGLIELADKGTLFLDEIADIPLHLQVKLLRVLEEKIVYRLGSITPKQVNFRLVSATNRNLKAMIKDGSFREDLFYRISTTTISIPPLRERKEDIPVLIRFFLERMNAQHLPCSQSALNALVNYYWPGNVRELKNVLERAVSLCNGSSIELSDLPDELRHRSFVDPYMGIPENSHKATLADNEKHIILSALEKNDWNKAKTAKELGIARATLYEKIKKYQISR
jgi:PAS domain S-box-containing protein